MRKQDISKKLRLGDPRRQNNGGELEEQPEFEEEEKERQEAEIVPQLSELVEKALIACGKSLEEHLKPTFGECLKLMQFARETGLVKEPPREIKVTWVEQEPDYSEE